MESAVDTDRKACTLFLRLAAIAKEESSGNMGDDAQVQSQSEAWVKPNMSHDAQVQVSPRTPSSVKQLPELE
eukprot:gene10198-8111_t